ncbi:L-threonylcarbamoyladenylate synthase [Paenibacillus polysaccharolyticus]|uniref:L-threonylcarbamoyladenylate synthase n=1 Tax=Paenibacillus polysaccharolyticus TaxID=582692 RepID=UPI00280BC0A9|nr:L-threonylcarbamoyladenylate synthase [Paenibacillus polysaccharolyticus]
MMIYMNREHEKVQQPSLEDKHDHAAVERVEVEHNTAFWDVRALVHEQSEGENINVHVQEISPVSDVKKGNAAREAALADLQAAAACLRQGETVAFPTETVYGLGADARSTEAVEAVFAAKGRPSDNPLIVHIAHRDQLHELVTEVNATAEALMAAFWPGPLTLVLPVRPGAVSPRVTAGLDTVAVRMPDHPVALPLIAAAACPVAAPSANRSGRPSPTLAAHVREDLDGRIGGIVDGGPTGVGVESTVVQAGDDGTVTILRPGGITAEQLSAVAARVATDPALLAEGSGGDSNSPAPRSPGMKYTHYAPAGALCVVEGPPVAVAAWTRAALAEAAQRGERTAVLAFAEHAEQYRADAVFSLGNASELQEAARRLYAALRSCDEQGATYIVAEACSREGLGAAVMNRLLKAAGNQLIQVG